MSRTPLHAVSRLRTARLARSSKPFFPVVVRVGSAVRFAAWCSAAACVPCARPCLRVRVCV